MTKFNSRSDAAAKALKGDLSHKLGREIPEREVPVGENGQPLPPAPPEGTYARQIFEQRRAQEAQQAARSGQPSTAEQLGDQPLAGTPDQAVSGSQAPPLDQPVPDTQQASDQPSPNAQRRIQELANQVRELERAKAEFASSQQELEQMRRQLDEARQQRDELIQNNLDHLDPETRASVMMRAEMQQLMDERDQRLMQTLAPHLSSTQQRFDYMDMDRLAQKYPRFDLQVHGPLIESMRGKHPSLTVEQAWRVVAEEEELVTREHASRVAVPPVAPAGPSASAPRYMPEPEGDPEAEMRETASRIRELARENMRSYDPEKNREAIRLIDQNLAERLSGKLDRLS